MHASLKGLPYLDSAPDIFLCLASCDSFERGACYLVDVLFERQRVYVLEELVVVIGAERLAHTLYHASVALQGGVQLGQLHCRSRLDTPRTRVTCCD